MVANGVSINKDDDSDEQIIPRPPDIEQDMKEMERRKRVKMITESQIFKDELERIIESQINEGYLPSTLSALQQVTDIISSKSSGFNNIFGHNITIPINDIRGVDAFRYDKIEKNLRCKLASVYRLVDLYGWSQLIYNHITVRINQEQEHFLINPFGLQYPEITASSLIKIDLQGNTIDPGSTNFTFNRAGFVLHSAIHAARPDIKAIIHIHYPPCVAVSALKHGLLCICQEAAIIGDVSYHDYKGLAIDTNLKESVSKDLGPVNKVLILKNHGVITCGETLEEALYWLQNLIKACETQVKLEPLNPDDLHQMSQESKDQVRSVVTNFGTSTQGKPDDEKVPIKNQNKNNLKKWKIWDLEFEAQMRMLDNAGYRTGHIYRQPLLRASQTRSNYSNANISSIEIPPAAQNHLSDSLMYDNWLTPLKSLMNVQKKEKTNWINTPNSYQKVETNDTDDPEDPKKVTKWINSSNGQAENIKINSHQFVPVNENGKKEFHLKQKKMKEYRRQNQISEGPQSRILTASLNDSLDNYDTRVVIGAASKGIIQKEYQQNAKIYKNFYEKNPFDNVDYDELDEYTNSIVSKNKNISFDQTDLHDESNELYQNVTSEYNENNPKSSKVQRSHSARLAAQALEDSYFNRKFRSERKPKLKSMSENTNEDQLNDTSISSKDVSNSEKSSKKDKKKKGIRAPSFLKKKKKDKKEAA